MALMTRKTESRWQDDQAGKLHGVDRLVYRSNKFGEDHTLTNTGGGNTSSKLIEKDPLTGENVEELCDALRPARCGHAGDRPPSATAHRVRPSGAAAVR